MAGRRKIVEVEVDAEYTARDGAMARLAAARACAQSAIEAIDEAIHLFVETGDDAKGKERTELIDSALEAAGMLSRALEAAQEDMKEVDPEECEPWDEDGDDEDEDDEEGTD